MREGGKGRKGWTLVPDKGYAAPQQFSSPIPSLPDCQARAPRLSCGGSIHATQGQYWKARSCGCPEGGEGGREGESGNVSVILPDIYIYIYIYIYIFIYINVCRWDHEIHL